MTNWRFHDLYRDPLHKKKNPQHLGQGDPIVTLGICCDVGESSQVILMWVKAQGV